MNDVSQTKDQLVAHYIHGLKPSMQVNLSVHTLYAIDEAYRRTKAMKKNTKIGASKLLVHHLIIPIRGLLGMLVVLWIMDSEVGVTVVDPR